MNEFISEYIITNKIKNSSKIIIGIEEGNSLTIVLDKHFTWFQKKMIKWCFGFEVHDYSEG